MLESKMACSALILMIAHLAIYIVNRMIISFKFTYLIDDAVIWTVKFKISIKWSSN